MRSSKSLREEKIHHETGEKNNLYIPEEIRQFFVQSDACSLHSR